MNIHTFALPLRMLRSIAHCAFAAVIIVCCLAGRSNASEDNADIFGRWRVIKVLDSADIAAMSDKQARALIGKRLEIGSMRLQFQGRTCKASAYVRKEVEPARYLREAWHARSGKLGLSDPVTVIDAQCTELFLKSKSHIVFNWDGFFFEAVKN